MSVIRTYPPGVRSESALVNASSSGMKSRLSLKRIRS